MKDVHIFGIFVKYGTIIEDPDKKNGAKFTEELRIVVWRPYILTTGLQRAPDWGCFHI
jgi:hypothetical protein